MRHTLVMNQSITPLTCDNPISPYFYFPSLTSPAFSAVIHGMILHLVGICIFVFHKMDLITARRRFEDTDKRCVYINQRFGCGLRLQIEPLAFLLRRQMNPNTHQRSTCVS